MQTDAGVEKLFDDGSTAKHNDVEIRPLTKRSLSGAKKGIAAAETILTGARKYFSTTNARVWIKTGNLQTAVDDFNSVKPVVKRQNRNSGNWNQQGNRRGNVLVGTVGDRRLILIMPKVGTASQSNPVLEIRGVTDALYDRIIYTTE